MRIKEQDTYLGVDEGWRILGASIVKQAAIDWHDAYKRLQKSDSNEMAAQKRSAESFLLSETCEFYSGMDGRSLIRRMKEM